MARGPRSGATTSPKSQSSVDPSYAALVDPDTITQIPDQSFESLMQWIENNGEEPPESPNNARIFADYEEQINSLLDRIPDREADLLETYFIRKKRQADIAEIFGVTQAAISYRLARGLQRIKFLLSVPDISSQQLRQDLHGVLCTLDVDILAEMWESTCQSEVAAKLELTQGRVRHRFFKAVKTLEVKSAKNPKLVPYVKFFATVSTKNWNILRAVTLPQWTHRGVDECA